LGHMSDLRSCSPADRRDRWHSNSHRFVHHAILGGPHHRYTQAIGFRYTEAFRHPLRVYTDDYNRTQRTCSAGFRRYWRWKSRSFGGRPQIDTELRALIRRMSIENPLWGAPRIHGELLNLGLEVAQSSVAKYMVKRAGPRECSETPNPADIEPYRQTVDDVLSALDTDRRSDVASRALRDDLISEVGKPPSGQFAISLDAKAFCALRVPNDLDQLLPVRDARTDAQP